MFGAFRGIVSHLKSLSESGVDSHFTSRISVRELEYDVTDYRDYRVCSSASWICFDLKDRRAHPTGYTLTLDGCLRAGFISWSMEGSENGKDWIVLDTQETQVLEQHWVLKTFSCRESQSASFRYLRVCQTEPKSRTIYGRIVSATDFFGILTVDHEACEARKRVIHDDEKATIAYTEEEA